MKDKKVIETTKNVQGNNVDSNKNFSRAGHDARNDMLKSGWPVGNREIKTNSDGGVVNPRDGADIAARFIHDVNSRNNS